MKDKSKVRANWTRQERNSKGHFMPYKKESEEIQIIPASLDHNEDGSYKKEKCSLSQMYERILEISEKPMSNLYEEEGKLKIRFAETPKKDKSFDLNDLEHAFLSGLKANNSFYPPSKLWEFYKRDRGLE